MTDSPAGFYRANAGDTVSSVASRLSIDPALLARRNGLSADAKLDAGELLRVTPMKATECSSNASSLVWPADGPVIRAFGSDGAKSIAIGGALGDPVKAAGAGRVIYAGNKIEGYGNLIVIKHDENLLTAYGNGRRILVKEGTTVRRGQIIAEMGDRVTGKPALLFEVRKNRAAVDPMQFLPAACAAQK